jgi:hypothetical protein
MGESGGTEEPGSNHVVKKVGYSNKSGTRQQREAAAEKLGLQGLGAR